MFRQYKSFLIAVVLAIAATGAAIVPAQASDADVAAQDVFGIQTGSVNSGPRDGLHGGGSRPGQVDPYDYDYEHR